MVEENITVINTASFVTLGEINNSVWDVGQLTELKVAAYLSVVNITGGSCMLIHIIVIAMQRVIL